MKGLLLKDYYVIRETGFIYFYVFIAVVVIAFGCLGDETGHMPLLGILSCIIPLLLLFWDEDSKWSNYINILPCSKKTIVAEKYVILLLMCLIGSMISDAMLALVMVDDAYKSELPFNAGGYISVVSLWFAADLFFPCLLIPFIFKSGTKRKKISFYICTGILTAVVSLTKFYLQAWGEVAAEYWIKNCLAAVASAIVFVAVSWTLSVRFYEKR